MKIRNIMKRNNVQNIIQQCTLFGSFTKERRLAQVCSSRSL